MKKTDLLLAAAINFDPKGETLYNEGTLISRICAHANAERMLMPPAGKVSDEDKSKLANIQADSWIYIIGYDPTTISSPNSNVKRPIFDQAFTRDDCSLQNYCDVIVNNSSLKAGDHINILLWVSNVGKNHVGSTAAKLAVMFHKKNINTTIICSQGFVGRPPVRLMTCDIPFSTDTSQVRAIECRDSTLVFSTVSEKSRVYLTPTGVTYEKASDLSAYTGVGFMLISNPNFMGVITDDKVRQEMTGDQEYFIRFSDSRGCLYVGLKDFDASIDVRIVDNKYCFHNQSSDSIQDIVTWLKQQAEEAHLENLSQTHRAPGM